LASFDEVFGSKGPKKGTGNWKHLPKAEGETMVAFFKGEHRWDPQFNQQTKKPMYMVLGEEMGQEKWLRRDKGTFDPEKYRNFELKVLVTEMIDDEGEFDLSWSLKGAEDALKAAMAETGLGIDPDVAVQIKLVDRSVKPFKFDVKLKKMES